MNPRTLAIAALAAILISNPAPAEDLSRQYAAVLCTSEANGPWTLKAQGTLTRTKTDNETAYKLEAGEHVYAWRFTTSREGATTVTGPGFLIDALVTPATRVVLSRSDPGGRRQNLYSTGEIREFAGANAMSLVIGSSCPKGSPRS